MNSRSTFIAVGFCTLLFRGLLPAQVVLDPDQYASGTILNQALPEVSLITAANNNLPHPPVPFNITAATSTFPFQPPTGNNVFAHAGVPFFNSDRRLRMDFNGLTSFLSIDFQGGNSLATEFGRLEVYGLGGLLLDTYTTAGLLGGQIETMSINRPGSDIAWAVAYTVNPAGGFGRLDHLVFAAPLPVPEPGLGVLILAAGLAVWRSCRRRA